MIDNVTKAHALIEKMQAAVPISARPVRQLVDLLRNKGISLGADPKLTIRDVLYAGDEGGIMCDVTPEGSKEVIVCSLTHLRVHPRHPLGGEIRIYQETRARQGGVRGITTITRDRQDQ